MGYLALPHPGKTIEAFGKDYNVARRYDTEKVNFTKAYDKRHKDMAVTDMKSNPADTRNYAVAVDAACSGNPGPMEYRGIYLRTGEEIFRFGPIHGTNNIGEFLAIVHALALLKQKNLNTMPIYSDSVNAQIWVKKKKCKTTLPHTPETEKLHQIITRAENWLRSNTYSNPIIKWPTEEWGEIPADFGRK